MKAIVVFYSRTGHTKRVAETIADLLDCDKEELIDTQDRSGLIGFIRSGYQALRKDITILKDINVSGYDLVIIGTPVWVLTMATPVRTFLHSYKDQLKKVAFFCTYGGMGAERTVADMEKICASPVAVLKVRVIDLATKRYTKKVTKFVHEL
jgi:flavodoxin